MDQTIQSHKDQRIGIFIDIQNLYHSAKNLFDSRVNYKALIDHIVAGRQLIHALAYVVQSEHIIPGTENGKETVSGKSETTFFDALEKTGIQLRIKDIQVYPGGAKKADWDVGMAIDAVRMADSLDVIILVTGDGDFIPLVDYLRWGKGKEIEVLGFSSSTNSKLKEAADRFTAVEDIDKSLTRIRKKGGRREGQRRTK
ncbi:MAG: NYN domain-containing protein [Candidatus Harrisonbacteria bacterium]|nr:NYN domain-containing protein [Candidatus Harrisonbacteria bacterium]